jgi:hypothetical protein
MFGFLFDVWGFTESTNSTTETESYSDSSDHRALILHRTLNDIVIEGSPEFVRFVGNCLFQISQHGKFVEVVTLLKQIKQVNSYTSAGMQFTGTFDVDLATLEYYNNDSIWGASQIIHDATHYQRMQDSTFNWANPVSEELIAFKTQESFLRDCGDYSKATYIASLDGRHCLR